MVVFDSGSFSDSFSVIFNRNSNSYWTNFKLVFRTMFRTNCIKVYIVLNAHLVAANALVANNSSTILLYKNALAFNSVSRTLSVYITLSSHSTRIYTVIYIHIHININMKLCHLVQLYVRFIRCVVFNLLCILWWLYFMVIF